MERKLYCAKHFAKLPHAEQEFDGGGRAVVLLPDPGQVCSFCDEPAVRIATPIDKDGE